MGGITILIQQFFLPNPWSMPPKGLLSFEIQSQERVPFYNLLVAIPPSVRLRHTVGKGRQE